MGSTGAWGAYLPSFIVIALLVWMAKTLVPDILKWVRTKNGFGSQEQKGSNSGGQSVDFWREDNRSGIREIVNGILAPILKELADVQRQQSHTQAEVARILNRLDTRQEQILDFVKDIHRKQG